MILFGVERFMVENKIYFIFKKKEGIEELHIKNVM